MVTPAWGNQLLNAPNGVRVNGTSLIDGAYFRCLFGGFIETKAIGWDLPWSVNCDTPPNNGSWLTSNRPNIIQVLNDNRNYGAVSNSLPFSLLLDPLPFISFISPTSADRHCYSTKTCSAIFVYGSHFSGGASITCSFFGTYTTMGSYAGQTRIHGTQYDRVSCPIATYPVAPMTGPVYEANGFQLLISRSLSGPSASNSVGWTYTCSPCDA